MEVKSFKCDLCKLNFTAEKDKLLHCEGKKHLKLVEQENNIKCGVFITGFNFNQSKEVALQYFSNFGGIKKSHVGPTMNYMIIVYDKEEEALKVLSNQHFLEGRKLRVEKRQRPPNFDYNDNDGKTHESLLQSLKNIDRLEDQINKFLILMTPDFRHISEIYHLVTSSVFQALSLFFSKYCIFGFGSSTTCLQFNSSDLDIYIDIIDKPENEKKCLKMIKTALLRSKLFHGVIDIPSAKIPIVKGIHNKTGIKCDINFKNMVGVENSKLIRYYLSLDHKLRPIMLIVKYWAKIQEISGRNHLFTSYSMVMMFIFYLQESYGFPSVYELQKYTVATDHKVIWNMNINQMTDTSKINIKFVSMLDILKGFFNYYSTFNFGLKIICPYLGKTVDKQCFSDVDSIPEEYECYKMNLNTIEPLKYDKPVCLQDPFEHNVNTSSIIFKNILERFITACSSALGILSKKEEDMLISLFSVSKNAIPTEKKKKIDEDPNTYNIFLEKGEVVNYLEPSTNTDLLEQWFRYMMNYCCDLFEKVLKLELTEILSNKRARVGAQQHVADNVKTFHARSFVNLWDSRNINLENIKDELSNCKTTLEKDIILSNHIWKKNEHIQPTTPLFDCNIILTCQNKPPRINIEIVKLNSYKKVFKSFALYVSSKIPQWYSVHIRELNKNPEIKSVVALNVQH